MLSDHGRSPNSRVQPISYRGAVEDVAEAAMLDLGQTGGPSGSVTFQEDHGLQPFRHAIGTLLLRLFTQLDQPALDLGMQPQQAEKHGYFSCEKYVTRKALMSLYLCVDV
jgi:hypothetical protein